MTAAAAPIDPNTTLSFIIFGAPVPKGRPRLGRGGHAFTPARTRAYEALVKRTAVAAIRDARWDALHADYHVDLRIYRKAKRGDVDNFAKAVCDALNGVAFPDDSMIVKLTMCRYDSDKKNPRVEVTIVRLPEAA